MDFLNCDIVTINSDPVLDASSVLQFSRSSTYCDKVQSVRFLRDEILWISYHEDRIISSQRNRDTL